MENTITEMDIMAMTDRQTHLAQFRNDHRIPLVLAGIITLYLLFLFSTFISDFRKTHHAMMAIRLQPLTQPPIHLANLHLFGTYSVVVANLPESTLQLTLQGTIVFLDNPNNSRAIVVSPGNPPQSYKTGDILPGNAKVSRIEKDYIVINDNGALQKVPLPIKTLLNE